MSLATTEPRRPDRTRPSRVRRSVIAEAVVVIALAVTAVVVLSGLAQRQAFSVDESRWISTSRYFWITFVDHDFFGPEWQPNYIVFTHPPVARYLIGAGLALQGWAPDQLNGRYDTDRSRDYNRRAGTIPGRELLLDARLVTGSFGFGALALLYLSGRTLGGPVAGAAATLLALFHPLLGTLWTRALAESILAFFCLLAFWLATRVAALALTGRGRYPWVLGLGAAVALAMATKLSGSLFAAGLGLYVVARQGFHWWTARTWSGLGPWIDAGMAAVVVFVLVNPLLYPNPVLRTALLFEHRRDEMEAQALGTPRLAVAEDPAVRAGVLFQRTFRDWGLFEERFGAPLDAPLAAAGLVLAAVATGQAIRRRAPLGPPTQLLCWTVAVFGVSTVNLGFDSSHYFAPPATVVVLLQAVAVSWLAGLALRFVQGRRASSLPEGAGGHHQDRTVAGPDTPR